MSRWDGDRSSASLALAKVLAKTNRVYYIDYPYTWADVWRERKLAAVRKRLPALLFGRNYEVPVTGQSENLSGVTPRPALPVYSLPSGKLYNIASHYNNGRIATLIKRIARQNGISDYLLINSFNPTYLAKVEKYLSPLLSVYHSRDAIEEVPGHGLEKENECVLHYDTAMATSKQLCRNIGARNGKIIHYFPNGGDVHLFKTAIEKRLKKPDELLKINTPIIGYTGAICQRINYDLLVKVATANPDKTIVLVGPRLDKEFTNIDLDVIPNIVFTGSKKLEELPAYLQYFDCTIIPFKKNNLTGGIYPLKINEYLAAGKAVVTTNFSEDIATFKDNIYLANDDNEFLQMINDAIKNNGLTAQQDRLQAASGNSWENRLHLFWDIVWEAYQVKNGKARKTE